MKLASKVIDNGDSVRPEKLDNVMMKPRSLSIIHVRIMPRELKTVSNASFQISMLCHSQPVTLCSFGVLEVTGEAAALARCILTT